jgi:hypothetical protein
MSENQSNLSGYGYDIVVATTEESINATLKTDLANHFFPPVKAYFIPGENGKTAAISYDNLMIRTKGTDPLKVDSYKVNNSNQQEITNVVNSKLVYAFEAAMGIPLTMPLDNVPDIITLAPDAQSANFSLICAQFTILAGNGTNTTEPYLKFIQADNTPWLITFTVPLKTITDNTNLPPDVKQKLDKLGPEFSVQQFIMDLSNALTDESRAKISGVQPGTPVYKLLTEFLTNNYLAELKSDWRPVFFYAFTSNTPPKEPSSLFLSDMKINLSQYSDPNNPKLNTLNYLCATNGNKLPQPRPFNWNWVDPPAQGSIPDGVIAIKRNTFAKYFQDRLTPSVAANCLLPSVKVVAEGGRTVFSCSFSRGQTPKVELTSEGPIVLNFSYSKSAIDGAGAGDDLGELSFSTTCNASVTFLGNTIIITQSLLLHVDLWSLQTNTSWNAINKTLTDTYTLAVTQNGDLTAIRLSSPFDKSQSHPTHNSFIDWFTNINEIADYVAQRITEFVPTSLQDIPVSVAQQFIFPGGKAFAFKQVEFSDHQDLTTQITYVQAG